MTVRYEVLFLVWLFVMCNLLILLAEAAQLAAMEMPR